MTYSVLARCEPVRSGPVTAGYRERVCLHAEWRALESRWAVGLRRGDDIIEIPECPVHSPVTREILKSVLARINDRPDLGLVYLAVSGPLVTLVLKRADLPDGLAERMRGIPDVSGAFGMAPSYP